MVLYKSICDIISYCISSLHMLFWTEKFTDRIKIHIIVQSYYKGKEEKSYEIY